MITHPVDITLSVTQVTAVLNADEADGRVLKSVTHSAVLKALHRRGLVTEPTFPSYLTADGREVVRQCIGHSDRKTFTLLRPNGHR